jgi:hypothetical protein
MPALGSKGDIIAALFRGIDCFEDSEPCVSRRTFSQLHNLLARTLPESDFLSALRSHAASCRAPAVKSEPNLERCQYYDADADDHVDRHGIAILEAKQPWRCD